LRGPQSVKMYKAYANWQPIRQTAFSQSV